MTVPSRVICELVLKFVSFATPKSTTFARSLPARSVSGTSITLSGLRSRWTIPCLCAAPTAPAICRIIDSARPSGKRPSAFTAARRLRPSRYSMIRNARSSTNPKS